MNDMIIHYKHYLQHCIWKFKTSFHFYCCVLSITVCCTFERYIGC